jgi:hypothetical protein
VAGSGIVSGYAKKKTMTNETTGYGWAYDDDDVAETWGNWVTAACNACSSYTLSSGTSTDGAWNNWVISTGTSASTSTIWTGWAEQADHAIRAAIRARHIVKAPPPETTEQRIAREERQMKERAEAELRAKAYQEQQKKEQAERDRAKRRARRLLTSNLTKEQHESLEKFGFFEVVVEGKTYRIRQGTHGNVRLLGADGKESKSFCIQPNGVPDEDAMLAQKLMLETDEASFLRIANARDLRN